MGKVKNWIKKKAQQAWDWTTDKFEDAKDWVVEKGENLIESAKELIDDNVPDWMKDVIRWTGEIGATAFEWINYTNPLFLVGKLTGAEWLMNITTLGGYFLNQQFRALNNYWWGTDEDEEGNPAQKLSISDFTNTASLYSFLDMDINEYMDKHVCRWISIQDFLIYYYGLRHTGRTGVLDYLEKYYGYSNDSLSYADGKIKNGDRALDVTEGIQKMFREKEGFLPYSSNGLVRGVYKTVVNYDDGFRNYETYAVYKGDDPSQIGLYEFDSDAGFFPTKDTSKGDKTYYEIKSTIYYYLETSGQDALTLGEDVELYTRTVEQTDSKERGYALVPPNAEIQTNSTYYQRRVLYNGNEFIDTTVEEKVNSECENWNYMKTLVINRCVVRRCRFLNNEFGSYTDEYKKLVIHLWRIYDYDVVSETNVNPVAFFVRDFAMLQELFYKYGWRTQPFTDRESNGGGVGTSDAIPTIRYEWNGIPNREAGKRFSHSSESITYNYYYYAQKVKKSIINLKKADGTPKYDLTSTVGEVYGTDSQGNKVYQETINETYLEHYFDNWQNPVNIDYYNTSSRRCGSMYNGGVVANQGYKSEFEKDLFNMIGKRIYADWQLSKVFITRYTFADEATLLVAVGKGYNDESSQNPSIDIETDGAILIKYNGFTSIGQAHFCCTAFDIYAIKYKLPVPDGSGGVTYENNYWHIFPRLIVSDGNTTTIQSYSQSYNYDVKSMLNATIGSEVYTFDGGESASIMYKNKTKPFIHNTIWRIDLGGTVYYPSLATENNQIMGMTYENHKFYTLSEVRLMVSQIAVQVMSYYKYKGYNVTPFDSSEHLQQFTNADQPIERNIPLNEKMDGFYEVVPYTYIVGLQISWGESDAQSIGTAVAQESLDT